MRETSAIAIWNRTKKKVSTYGKETDEDDDKFTTKQKPLTS